jgi:CBS domain containing-hemolysin-like protein
MMLSTLVFAVRDFSLRKLTEIAEERGGLARVQPIIDEDDAHARALSFARLLANLGVMISVVLLVGPLSTVSDTQQVVNWPSVAIALGLSAALLFAFATLIPLSLAANTGERLLYSIAPLVRLIHLTLLPISKMHFVETAVKRLAGDQSSEREMLEDELLSAVSEGERSGQLGASERDMIESVMEMTSKTVEEIMTPRTEVEGFEYTNDIEFIKNFITTAGHSRIPVYEGDLDHIVGILYAKDLIDLIGHPVDSFELRPILRQAQFVPESKAVNELMVQLQQAKVHLAIVIDEYGGTAGLVTFEDILEEIVGDIQDEYEPEDEREPEITVDAESKVAVVDARLYIDDANDKLKAMGVSLSESDEYDTVGGWVLSELGHIPVVDEVFETVGVRVTVLEAEPTRVHRLRMEAIELDESGQTTESESPMPDEAEQSTEIRDSA